MMTVVAEPKDHVDASAGDREALVPRRWYALALFVLAYGINNLDKAIISVVVAPLMQEFQLSDVQISLLSGLAITLPYALVCIPMGMLADRSNRKWLLVVILLCWSLATVGAGFVTSVALLFLARICVGVFEAGFSPVTMSLIGDFFPKRSRSTALGLFALGGPIGLFLAMGVGAVIAADHGWRTAFLIAGAPGVLLTVVIAATIREPARAALSGDKGKAVTEEPQPLAAALRQIVTNRALFNVMLGMVLSTALMAAMAVWLPTFFARVHGLPGKSAGLMSAMIIGICGGLGAAVGGVMADRLAGSDARKLTMVSATNVAAAICTLAAFLLSADINVILVLMGAGVFLAQGIFGTGYGLVISLAPTTMRATVLSTLFVCFNVLSYGGGSFIVGFISDHLTARVGVHAIAYGMSAMALVSCWAAVHLLRAAAILRQADRLAARA
jgi:MFS family permease